MSLILHKELIEDEGETIFLVTCKANGGAPVIIPHTYSFASTLTNPEMETIIVADLTGKGYTDLSPIEWQ